MEDSIVVVTFGGGGSSAVGIRDKDSGEIKLITDENTWWYAGTLDSDGVDVRAVLELPHSNVEGKRFRQGDVGFVPPVPEQTIVLADANGGTIARLLGIQLRIAGSDVGPEQRDNLGQALVAVRAYQAGIGITTIANAYELLTVQDVMELVRSMN